MFHTYIHTDLRNYIRTYVRTCGRSSQVVSAMGAPSFKTWPALWRVIWSTYGENDEFLILEIE